MKRRARRLEGVLACVLLISGCVSPVPPPALSGVPSSLTQPATIHIAREDRFGPRYPWRINVNGVDVGSLAEGDRCSFETMDSTLSFAADDESGGLLVAQSVAFSLLLTPLILPVFVPRVSMDRYKPMSPQVLYAKDGEQLFLLLGGDSEPVLTLEDEGSWTARASDLDPVDCAIP